MKSLAFVLLLSTVAIAQQPQTKLVPIGTRTGFDPAYGSAAAQVWKKTPAAKYHHAVVRVECNTGYAGTGAIFKTDSDKHVFAITNHHVIEGSSGQAIVGTGGRASAKVIYANHNADIAVLYCYATAPIAIPIAATTPPIGTDIELCGYGGPVPHRLRHFAGKRCRASDYGYPWSYPVSIAAPCVSGDSGGPMLHNGELVGVNFGGPGVPQKQFAGWGLTEPSSSNVNAEWLQETLTQICQPYGCAPVIGSGQVIYSQPQQSQPVQSPQPEPAQPQIDIKQLADELAKRPELRGRDGQDGKDGRDGKDGKDAQLTDEQLALIGQAVANQLRTDPKLRGSDGKPGAAGPAGPPGASPSQADIEAAVISAIKNNPELFSVSLALMRDGIEIDRDTVALGGTLRLEHYSVTEQQRATSR